MRRSCCQLKELRKENALGVALRNRSEISTDYANLADKSGDCPTDRKRADKRQAELRDRGEGCGEEEVLDPENENIMDEINAIGVGGEGFPAAWRIMRRARRAACFPESPMKLRKKSHAADRTGQAPKRLAEQEGPRFVETMVVLEIPGIIAGDAMCHVSKDAANNPKPGVLHQRRTFAQDTPVGAGSANKHSDDKISKIEQDAGELESERTESDPGGTVKDQDERK